MWQMSHSGMSKYFEEKFSKLRKLKESPGCSGNIKDFRCEGSVRVVWCATVQTYRLDSEKVLLSFGPELSKVKKSESQNPHQLFF